MMQSAVCCPKKCALVRIFMRSKHSPVRGGGDAPGLPLYNGRFLYFTAEHTCTSATELTTQHHRSHAHLAILKHLPPPRQWFSCMQQFAMVEVSSSDSWLARDIPVKDDIVVEN